MKKNNNENDSLKSKEVFTDPPETLSEFQKLQPYPLPETLSKLKKLHPDFVDKFVSMADKEQKHRHKMEEKALDADILCNQNQSKQIHLGQILGFLIGIFALGCGTFAAIKGAEISGGLIGTGGVIGLVSAFIFGGRMDSKSS